MVWTRLTHAAERGERRVTSIGGVIISLLPGVDVTGVDVESTVAASTASIVEGSFERQRNWRRHSGFNQGLGSKKNG